MKLRAITHADLRRIRLRSEAALPYQGIPAKPAQPAKRTRTGIQAPRPPQPPKPPPTAGQAAQATQAGDSCQVNGSATIVPLPFTWQQHYGGEF